MEKTKKTATQKNKKKSDENDKFLIIFSSSTSIKFLSSKLQQFAVKSVRGKDGGWTKHGAVGRASLINSGALCVNYWQQLKLQPSLRMIC